MNYILIFHANLNYAYLPEHKYEFVIRKSYELIVDTMKENFPDCKYVFEASGFTIEQIGKKTPDVLEKLKVAIQCGQCEFMGSPYAHPMLPNFPKEDGIWSVTFSNEIYEKYLGIRPISFWNPECGWRSYIYDILNETGYKNLVGDFEAYSRSVLPNGNPIRPEIYEKEYSREPAFYNFGFKYDLPGEEKTIHYPFNEIYGQASNKLKIFLRSDRIAQFGVRYFMGMDGYSFDKYIDLITKYSKQSDGERGGALIIFADDAEYIGTNGWFRLKYENKPDNVFEETPESKEKLIRLVSECQKKGKFITFDDACTNIPALDKPIYFDNDSAWHGVKASTWANTPMARLLRPWQDLVREKINSNVALPPEIKEKVWYHLTNSYNSDGQWPPTLPESPHIIFPDNYRYCFSNLLMAEHLVNGVDRDRLKTDPVNALKEILIPQAKLIEDKANTILIKDPGNRNAKKAQHLIVKCRNFQSIEDSCEKILYPDEYELRANLLVEARELLGGVEIEISK